MRGPCLTLDTAGALGNLREPRHGDNMPRPQPGKPTRIMPRLLISSGLLALGGLALLGLPGAACLELVSPVVGLVTERRAEGDAAWPMAILHTIFWPWLLLPAYAVAATRFSAGRPRVLATTALTVLGALVLAMVMQVSAGRV